MERRTCNHGRLTDLEVFHHRVFNCMVPRQSAHCCCLKRPTPCPRNSAVRRVTVLAVMQDGSKMLRRITRQYHPDKNKKDRLCLFEILCHGNKSELTSPLPPCRACGPSSSECVPCEEDRTASPWQVQEKGGFCKDGRNTRIRTIQLTV